MIARATVAEWLGADFRGHLLAEGLARDLIWNDGVLPRDAPRFRDGLSLELVNYAFGLANAAIQRHEVDPYDDLVIRAFEAAAQALESAVRRAAASPRNSFLTVIAAAAYHLARQNAMATVLIGRSTTHRSRSVTLFAHLLTHRLSDARLVISEFYRARLEGNRAAETEIADEFALGERALELNFHRSVAALLAFFATGDGADIERARERLTVGIECSSKWGIFEAWWLHRLTALLLDDFERRSLHLVVPQSPDPALTTLRADFIDALAARPQAEIDLWPSQLVAVDVVFDDRDLVLALPTSAGKTRVAELCMLPVLAAGQNVVYVSPLRALSAQIERELGDVFERADARLTVSRMYDPAARQVAGQPRINVCTPERLDFALRHGDDILQNVGLVVLDEGHLIGPEPRELRYELLIERILRFRGNRTLRIVALSALLPPASADAYCAWLAGNTGAAVPRRSAWLPSRRNFGTLSWRRDHARLDLEVESQTPFIEHFVDAIPPKGRRKTAFPNTEHELLLAATARLISGGESVLIFCPNRNRVESLAANALTLERQGYIVLPAFDVNWISPAEHTILDEWLGHDNRVTKCLRRGIAVHHAGLPTAVLAIVERLMRARLVTLIVASPTVAQGLNVSASTVLFESLQRRVDNATTYMISPDEFQNVVGRAGRAFVDVSGKIIYSTGMNPKATRYRQREWRDLRASVGRRTLESGLATLIVDLIARLGGRLDDAAIDFLAEHVNVDRTITNDVIAGDDEAQYDGQVDLLDDALNALLGATVQTEDEVAGRLDAVFRSSLFRQTLALKLADVRHAIERLILRRARGIVRRYPWQNRVEAYRSGVSPRHSRQLADFAAQLSLSIRRIESAVEQNTIDNDVLGLLAQVCTAILTFPTFSARAAERVENGEAVVSEWLRGSSMADLVWLDPKAREFVEEALKGYVVWGYEAVRRIVIGGEERALTATTLIATGTPSLAASLLVREGLDSRPTAARVGAMIRDVELTSANLHAWVLAHRTEIVDVLEPQYRSIFIRFADVLERRTRIVDEVKAVQVDVRDAAPAVRALVFLFVSDRGIVVTDRDLRPFAEAARTNLLPGMHRGVWLGGGAVDLEAH